MQKVFSKTATYIRHYHSYILSALILLLTILAIYWRDFEILINEALHNESTSHVLLVPFFIGLLLYWKKDLTRASVAMKNSSRKKSTEYIDEILGVALCLAALLLYWYGSYTFYPLEYHIFSLPIFVAGTILILFNFKTLQLLIVPILFTLFLIPPPTEIIYTIGGLLANFNTQASYTILNTMGIPVSLQTSYGPPTITVQSSSGQPILFAIDIPCSGMYSLIAFVMIATFLAYSARTQVYKKAGMFILGFAVFGALNILRITTIISIGYWLGEEIAMFIFHNITGWLLIFVGMLLILVVVEKLWHVGITQPPLKKSTCSQCKKSQEFETFCTNCGNLLKSTYSKISKKFWAKLILLLIGAYVATLTIQAPTFVVAQGPLTITSDASWETATDVFPEISGYRLTFLYRDTAYEKLARQDASLLYGYFPLNVSEQTIYVDLGVANTISNLHSWEVCLITLQTAQGRYPLVDVKESREIQLYEDAPLIARYLIFESPTNYTQVTLYWYQRATFNTGITVVQKYVRISLIILTRNATDSQKHEDTLLTFALAISSHWTPLLSQSLVSIGIPMQQALFGLAVAFVAVTKTAEYTASWKRKNRNLRIFNNHASQNEKLVFQTIQDLFKKAKFVRTKQIASALRQKTKTLKQHETLNDILKRLEMYELIKRDIVSVDGAPILVWRLQNFHNQVQTPV